MQTLIRPSAKIQQDLNEAKTSNHKTSLLKKMFIYVGCLVALIGLCVLTVYPVYENSHVVIEDDDRTPRSPMSEEQAQLEMRFSDAYNSQYNSLLRYWGDVLPDYYGGAFIKDRIFHVLVTCDPEDVREEIVSVTENPNVDIRQCEYSYNELTELRDRLSTTLKELYEEKNEVAMLLSAMMLEEKKNRVRLNIYENDQDKADEFASLLGIRNDKRVRFVYAPYRITYA